MKDEICIRGAREHNLKNINVSIPKNKLVVVTGVSGSGKSSLAFDTIYAEGQRRYVESLSTYARQFLEIQNKPAVDSITGLSPAIAIDQKNVSRNPRSTVCTATEIYDYMRLLYARVGIPYSPVTGKEIKKQSASQIVAEINKFPLETRLTVLSPIIRGRKGEFRKEFLSLRKQGYHSVRIDGEFFELEKIPLLDKNKRHDVEVVMDRIELQEEKDNRLADSVESAIRLSSGLVAVLLEKLTRKTDEGKEGEVLLFSENFSCPVSNFSITEIEPRIFSFNSPYGACSSCDGLSKKIAFDNDLIIPDDSLSLQEGAIAPWRPKKGTFSSKVKFYAELLASLARYYGFSMYEPYEKLDDNIKDILLYGSGDEKIEFMHSGGYASVSEQKVWAGVIAELEEDFSNAPNTFVKEELGRFQDKKICEACEGYRLRKESLCIKIKGKHIGEICRYTVLEALDWVKMLRESFSENELHIGERVLNEVEKRLGFLKNVGLEYLTLNREAGTLSGGESQRIRLASQIGAGLSGVLYVLDEPSIGLHQRDNFRLLETLRKLRDLGNTVIVVEHDKDTISLADYILDIGKGAGVYGGELIAYGTPDDIMKNRESLTGRYLSGLDAIEVPKVRRKGNGRSIRVIEASANNLQNITVEVPLGKFTVVTGVSGSGKSTFTIGTLYKAAAKKLHNSKAKPLAHRAIYGLEYINKIIQIDQLPIGRTPRSNPATYTGAFTLIRDLFTSLPESRLRGYKPGRFSFNVKGGRCEACEGDGVIKIEMNFLPDVYVVCEDCKGKRYNNETLEIKYKGKSISDILDMTVEEVNKFFEDMPMILEKVSALKTVGLNYMKLGQSATTLSGGEAQRIKLAKELSRQATGRTLYILDEPTTGLHLHDINALLKVLHRLVEGGNTVLVIEHNIDVIKTADHIIDIGPDGGDKGGRVVVVGTPEEVVKVKESVTGKFLAETMNIDLKKKVV